MGGAAAYVSGKAIAQTWRPFWQVPLYMLLLAAVVRFFHFALFEEPLLSLPSYLVDYRSSLVCGAASATGWCGRTDGAAQYGWLFQRGGPARLARKANDGHGTLPRHCTLALQIDVTSSNFR